MHTHTQNTHMKRKTKETGKREIKNATYAILTEPLYICFCEGFTPVSAQETEVWCGERASSKKGDYSQSGNVSDAEAVLPRPPTEGFGSRECRWGAQAPLKHCNAIEEVL